MRRQDSIVFESVGASNVGALAEGLSALHEAVRGERRDPRYWRWCYVDNPLGSAATAVALRDGRVVGRLGNVPLPFVAGGRRLVAGLFEGLQILPAARSWSCYLGLIEKCCTGPTVERMAFGYAFVTRGAAQLSERTGSVRLGRVPFVVGFLDVRRALEGRSVPPPLSLAGGLFQPWLGLRRRGAGARRNWRGPFAAKIVGQGSPASTSMRTPARGAGAHLDIRPVARFDGAFDDLWQSIETKRFAGPTGPTGPTVAALRDAAYLNWRYTTCPGRRYTCLAAYRAGRRAPDGGRLDGLLVFTPSPRPKLRDAFILELLARNDDQDVLRALLLRALTMLARAGLALVAASFPTGSAEAAVLRDLGFLPWAGWVLGIELVLTPTTEKGPCPAGHLSNWYFSLGDWLAY